MEGKSGIEYNYEKIKKSNISKIPKEKQLNHTYYKILNFILLKIFLILLLSKKSICEVQEHYVEIKVNKNGYNQILSDKYFCRASVCSLRFSVSSRSALA